ncbi:MAG: hypothetical protein U9R75_03475 [Candidatus Thermoplasmatota archaeon]|nr:hypothetical protein [Candidatus Thermoplasmatota archaeon]
MKIAGKDTSAKAVIQEIGEVHAAERGSISLTRLPDEFYERATTYLRTTLAKIENARSSSEQVVSEDYYRSTEEYRRGKEILTNIYNTRERKIVLMAMNSSRNISQSTDSMVHDEMDLFFSLKFELEKIRDRTMRIGQTRTHELIRGETGINTPITDYNEEEGHEELTAFRSKKVLSERLPEVSVPEDPEEVIVTDNKEEDPGMEQPQGTRLVRAVKDISTFMCPDNSSVTMKKEDVALLHGDIVQLLINGGYVELMEESD